MPYVPEGSIRCECVFGERESERVLHQTLGLAPITYSLTMYLIVTLYYISIRLTDIFLSADRKLNEVTARERLAVGT